MLATRWFYQGSVTINNKMEKEINVPPLSLLKKVVKDFGVGDYDYILFKVVNEGYEVIIHESTGRGDRCTTKIRYSSDMETLSESDIEVNMKSIHVDQEPESRNKLLLEIARKVAAKEFSGVFVKPDATPTHAHNAIMSSINQENIPGYLRVTASSLARKVSAARTRCAFMGAAGEGSDSFVKQEAIGSKIIAFDHEREESTDLFDFYLEIEGWVSSLILACAKMSGYTKIDEKEMEKIQNEMVDGIDEMESEMTNLSIGLE